MRFGSSLLAIFCAAGLIACGSTAQEPQARIDLSELEWEVRSGAPEAWNVNSEAQLDSANTATGHRIPINPAKVFDWQAGHDLHHVTLRAIFPQNDEAAQADLNSLANPALALSGIGDNWAVYLNDRLLREELYPSADGDSILNSRYKIRTVIPFPAALLKPDGNNILTIHLVGHAPAPLTFGGNFFGLRFQSGNVIGDSTELQQEQFQFPRLVLYSVFLFFGLYHGMLFIYRRDDRYNLYFSAFLIGMAFYFFARSNYASSLLLDQRWMLLTIFASQILCLSFFLGFLRSYFPIGTAQRPRIYWVYALHAANIIFFTAMVLLSYRYYRSLLLAWYIFALPQLIYAVVYIVRANLRGIKEARWMVLAVGASVLFVVWDMLDTFYFHTNIRFLEYAILFLVLALVAILAGRFVSLHGESERLNLQLAKQKDSFYRFVPTEFLKLLQKKDIADVQLGDQMRGKMTVLFSDIRNFTQLSDTMSPEENFEFINDYLMRMEPAIRRHDGFVDKYIGDAIMALFRGKPDDALRAGIAMLVTLRGYNEERLADGLIPLQIGMGVNTGALMLGTVGGMTRMDTTVIGGPVNLAARLESTTKRYGLPLLLTEHTVEALEYRDTFYLRIIDRIRVRGVQEPVLLYECFDHDPAQIRDGKLESRERILEGMRLLHAGEVEAARTIFTELQQALPEDPMPGIFLERCEQAELKRGSRAV
ncbi:MAG: adenylate/guanylate cyclase domain-containing protein [bacterium]|nr:adenylate/guanylate cyclase domain-containing protein [bacterium]